jgi:hemoglobin-like flavoprotein
MNVWSHPLASMHKGRAAPAPIDLGLIGRLRTSFESFSSAGDRFPDRVFASLFESAPELRSLFPEDLSALKHRVTRMLHWLMAHLHEPQKLRIALVDLGRRHQEYNVMPEHYPLFCDALVDAMGTIGADDWNDQIAHDWRQTFELMTDHMLRAYPNR